MEDTKRACEICLMPVTHPVCLDCYMKHVKYWMRDINLDMRKKREIIAKIRKRLFKETLNNDNCILCGKQAVSVCTYCFFSNLFKIISQSKLKKHSISSFLEVFNYSIEGEYESQKSQENGKFIEI